MISKRPDGEEIRQTKIHQSLNSLFRLMKPAADSPRRISSQCWLYVFQQYLSHSVRIIRFSAYADAYCLRTMILCTNFCTELRSTFGCQGVR